MPLNEPYIPPRPMAQIVHESGLRVTMPVPEVAPASKLFALELRQLLDDIQSMLLAKNRKYGDSALNPKQIFSTASPAELINIRLDDKLSRIRNRQNDEDEDVEIDIIGYLLLKQIAKKRATRKPQ